MFHDSAELVEFFRQFLAPGEIDLLSWCQGCITGFGGCVLVVDREQFVGDGLGTLGVLGGDEMHLLASLLDAFAVDALALEFAEDVLVEDGAEAAEFVVDAFGLLDDPPEDGVLRAVLVDEVAAVDDRPGLELAVDAAVPLFEPRGVPGDIEIKEIEAMLL